MEGKEPLISIIVPVYQVKKYLTDCVESLEAQTFADREILLVDDGSTDGSGELCDVLADHYQDIRVLHKKNGGLADARNAGLRVAKGQYVGFVDSDDKVAPDFYESLYQALQSTGSRIACCNWVRMTEEGCIKEPSPETLAEALPEACRVLDKEEAVRELLLDQGMTYSACDKLFERSLFEEDPFPGGRLPSEDIPCIYYTITKCDRIVHTGAPKYYYRVVQGSISNKRFKTENMSTFVYMQQVKEDVCRRFPALEREAVYALLQCAGAIYTRLLQSGMRKQFRQEEKLLKGTVRKALTDCLKNPYFPRNAKLVNLLMAAGLYPAFLRCRGRKNP